MSWSVSLILVLLTLLRENAASPLDGSGSPGASGYQAHSALQSGDTEPTPEAEEDMATGELEPLYPATRAANVARHYLNTRHGSPFKWFGAQRVQKASLEDMAERGMKYSVEFLVHEMISNRAVGLCSAEVLFPGGEEQQEPQVQSSWDGLLQINTTAEDEAFYQQYRHAESLVSGQDLPDSHGHIAPEMKPFWHLGGVASSFIMLRESNESTLYNTAQVANFTQLETQSEQLRFQYHVLLHEMVSQEIIHWKMLVSWSPAEGVKVLETQWQPKCHECEPPIKTTVTAKPSPAS